jgi:putative endonuclease
LKGVRDENADRFGRCLGMPSSPKYTNRASLGQRAEDIACQYLQRVGFAIIARNVRVGRLELDLIAQRGVLIVFCEVRSRSDTRLMTPAQTIGPLKVRRVRHAAAQWLRHHHHGPVQVRFDVASIVFDAPNGRLNYLEGAF